ncbi:MAG: hypothetical protein HYX86_03500 [Chloroflexi bacterium]|nr:hypothetical protein [Chloroflexota bacterium]
MNFYPWVVFLHILGAFLFIMPHGASAVVAFKLRNERDIERVRALLELSTYSLSFMYAGFLILLVTGIIAGFMGNWWGQGWIWASLGLLIAVTIVMTPLGSLLYSRVRKAVGLPYFEGLKMKQMPPLPPASPEEIARILSSPSFSSRPVLLAVIGIGGIAIILWLMMFKPF